MISGLAQASFAEHTPITSNVVGGLLLAPLLKSPTAAPDSVGVIGSLMVQSCLQPARGLVVDTGAPAAAAAPAASAELAQSLPFTTVLNAFLLLPPEFILKLALDPAGSHVFDAFLQAPCALASVSTRPHFHWRCVVLLPWPAKHNETKRVPDSGTFVFLLLLFLLLVSLFSLLSV